MEPPKNQLLEPTWGPPGVEMVGVLNFSARFRCQLGARIPTISTPEFPVLLKMPSNRYLGGFRHPFGSILGAFWSPLGSILLPFRCPIAPFQPAFNCFRTSPVVRILASSDGLLVHIIFIFAISVPFSFNSSSIWIPFPAEIGSILIAS